MDPVRAQYERFPYPPLPTPALPRAARAPALAYEHGLALARAAGIPAARRDHAGIRILVAGAGTFEAALVAELHPRAREVVAVDVSANSIARLERRLRWARLRDVLHLRVWRGRALAPVRTVAADLREWSDGGFDYILASNVLQHLDDPAAMLARLAAWLEPHGLLRVVTYPKASRYWMRATGAWLRLHGLGADSPALVPAARAAIRELPPQHPIRAGFETHREAGSATGIVDAFLHARERPLAPLEWGAAAAHAGLTLVAEDQRADCRAEFLDALVPKARTLDVWRKLEVLDQLLELAANPVWWFAPAVTTVAPIADPEPLPAPAGDHDLLTAAIAPERIAHAGRRALRVPSQTWWQFGSQLRQAAAILAGANVTVAAAIEALRAEVGPHWSPSPHPRLLPGHSLTEYDLDALRCAPPPWGAREWRQLQALRPGARLRWAGQVVPGTGLSAQAQWLQLRVGTVQAVIDCELGPG